MATKGGSSSTANGMINGIDDRKGKENEDGGGSPNQSRSGSEDGLISKVKRQNSYPIQSSGVFSQKLPASPLEEKPAQIKIPRAIKACKDAKKYSKDSRTIVLCLDGTGDKFDSDNSNIVHLVACLKKDDRSQVTYYQAGIGTYGERGLSGGFSAAADMAVGSGLGLHVRDAYHFLMHSYKEGDKICLFGFSRGAYTARCLAGMIHKVGILPPRNIAQIPFAYEFYKDGSPEGWKQSAEFKKTFCIDANVYFVGVFDSVNSVGFVPRQLPLSSTPTNKSYYFRQALALDERRAKFKPCYFQKQDAPVVPPTIAETTPPSAIFNGAQPPSAKSQDDDDDTFERGRKPKNKKKKKHNIEDDLEFDNHKVPFDTNAEEVWFLGAHADVGGGAVHNDIRHKLSNVPLRWMIRQCFLCNTGISFHTKRLAEVGLDVHMLWPEYKALPVPLLGPSPSMIEQYEAGLPPKVHRGLKLIPDKATDVRDDEDRFYNLTVDEDERQNEWIPEQVEDWFDAMSSWNDQLVQAKGWWILEIAPVEVRVQKKDSDEWESITAMNLGRYRGIPHEQPKMHWTVQARMRNMGYKLQARYGRNAHWQVVV